MLRPIQGISPREDLTSEVRRRVGVERMVKKVEARRKAIRR
jgi:hypothetical protein